jgi:hypothetical protein
VWWAQLLRAILAAARVRYKKPLIEVFTLLGSLGSPSRVRYGSDNHMKSRMPSTWAWHCNITVSQKERDNL